jgi:hypothetical protein
MPRVECSLPLPGSHSVVSILFSHRVGRGLEEAEFQHLWPDADFMPQGGVAAGSGCLSWPW